MKLIPSAAATALLIAVGCVPPPPPAGAPTVTTQIVCFEEWHDLPPPFGDGHPYNVFYWKNSTASPGEFRVKDDATGGYNGQNTGPNGGEWWSRLQTSGSIEWHSYTGAWVILTSMPAPTILPPRCSWAAPPI